MRRNTAFLHKHWSTKKSTKCALTAPARPPEPKTQEGRDKNPMDEKQPEQLRLDRNLRPLRSEEEGTGIHNLPGGVYGFSYAPATETPVFVRNSYHSFEVHKFIDGTSHMLAYVTPDQAEKILTGREDLDVTVYPEPFESSTTLVTIPFSRVLSNLYKPARADGNAIPLKLAPA
jgi:hypothetical protein